MGFAGRGPWAQVVRGPLVQSHFLLESQPLTISSSLFLFLGRVILGGTKDTSQGIIIFTPPYHIERALRSTGSVNFKFSLFYFWHLQKKNVFNVHLFTASDKYSCSSAVKWWPPLTFLVWDKAWTRGIDSIIPASVEFQVMLLMTEF